MAKKNQNTDGVIFISNTLHKMCSFIMIGYIEKLTIRYSWLQLVSALYFLLRYLKCLHVLLVTKWGSWVSLSVVAVVPASTAQRWASLQCLDPACQVKDRSSS